MIELGLIVRLKSGGPKMTVSRFSFFDKTRVECKRWQEDTFRSTFHSYWFWTHELEIILEAK